MKEIKWSPLKSEELKRIRGVSFEEIINAKLIGIKKHPSRKNQNIMLFEYREYVWVVPYVVEKNYIFLKHYFLVENIQKNIKRGE